MATAGLLAGIAGVRLQYHADRSGRWSAVTAIQLLTTIAMLAYLNWIWDQPFLARLFPFSSAIILGNWFPVAGAFFAGICAATSRINRSRRMTLVVTLLLLCSYSLVNPLLGRSPNCLPQASADRLMEYQTTDQTCSAACAAGLLKLHAIDATENELSRLCLTREGTHWLGIYRGLKLKTEGTEWDVVVEEVTREQLLSHPNLKGILALSFVNDSSRTHDTGFGSQTGHTVICFGTTEVRTIGVFDPSPDFGFESWNDRVLEGIEKAILFRLESRSGNPSPFSRIDSFRPSTWNHSRSLASVVAKNQERQ